MISIVIPIYNGERFLRPCLDSILSQSVRELEVICVNDGSKDGTQSILEEYAAKDPRVVVLQQENQGIAAARNSGMDRATGEYLWFFDGDDVMQPGAAEAMLHRVQETGADLVMGNYQYYHQVSKEIQTPGQRVKTVVLRGNERMQAAHITPLCGCKLWRTAFLREHDIHFWELKLGEDTTFFLHGLALCETVAMLDKNIYYYRIYDGSTSYTYSLKELEFIKAFDQLDQWYAAQGDLEAFRRELFFDRMFYYVSVLDRLPRHKSKQEREAIFEGYIKSRNELDLSSVQDREDIMDLVREFDRRTQKRAFYESEPYAVAYRTGRRAKHLLKKLRYAKSGVEL